MSEKSSISTERSKLTRQLDWAIRELSASEVMLSSSIAHRVGMNASDLKCAELLARIGPMTAGELAELSGLTTGAITGVVDRLMKAGWAERQPDLSDRRRVIIRPVPQDARPIEGLYEPYVQLMSGLLAEYDDQELALILDFVRRLSSVNHQSALKIRTGME